MDATETPWTAFQRYEVASGTLVLMTTVNCGATAAADRPYNFNFLNSRTEKSFYCTHLIYRAYLHSGIDLNSQRHFLGLAGPDSLILPREIWEACEHRQVAHGIDLGAG